VIQFVVCNPKRFSLIGAPVAQLDRASGYEPEGREFDSLRARHFSTLFSLNYKTALLKERLKLGSTWVH
jgi:hypothetical protein